MLVSKNTFEKSILGVLVYCFWIFISKTEIHRCNNSDNDKYLYLEDDD